MDKVRELLRGLVAQQALVQVTLSNPRHKSEATPSKVKAKPVIVRGEPHFQLERTVGTKVLHENIPYADAADLLAELLGSSYKQALVQAKDTDYQVLVNKKGQETILQRGATKTSATALPVAHNRQKHYVLAEGEPVPFLVELGVMNASGKVLAHKYDKFRQMNRFLEMVADSVPHLAKDKPLTIIDFGCGKSYLTFALYHYLVHTLGLDIRIIGLDLKVDVIRHCTEIADKLGYDRLQFSVGDINRYEGATQVDMVVTLHACDTATDAALEKAVRWGADVILSVPCCQHELFAQVDSDTLAPMLSHGIIRERFSAMATDAVRAHLLELVGYKAQILEFIDLEHTPKNLLIRAVKQAHKPAYVAKQAAAYLTFRQFLHIDPYLERALADRLRPVLDATNVFDNIRT